MLFCDVMGLDQSVGLERESGRRRRRTVNCRKVLRGTDLHIAANQVNNLQVLNPNVFKSYQFC